MAGFGYARAANPTEISEIPDSSPDIDIYVHPILLNNKAKSYRKGFNLYALGLVLIESGLWRTLNGILLSVAGLSTEFLHLALDQRDDLLHAERAKRFGGSFARCARLPSVRR